MLTRTMTLIATGEPLGVVLHAIVSGMECNRPGMFCSILLRDQTGERLLLGAAPSLPTSYNEAINGARIGPREGSCGTAAFTGETVIVADIQTDPLWTNYRHLTAQAGLASCWSEPIFAASGRVLGSFAIYHRYISTPTEADLKYIQDAAHLAAVAIERNQALEALAASEARAQRAAANEKASARDLETFFNVSSDLLCICDLQGRLTRVNRAWETRLGYPAGAHVGSHFSALVHPDDIAGVMSGLAKLERDGEEITYVNRMVCADGGHRQIEWRASHSGDLLFCLGRDVTERMRAQAAMREARVEAETANRAKSEFLANMSHEVRTPLNGVIGVVGALARTELTPPQREMVELIQSSSAMLERLVSDILDISKIEAGQVALEVRRFDLGAAFSSVFDVARIRAEEKGLVFHVRQGETARGLFTGDSVRLKQVLGNLLSNAVKFTARGAVTVIVEVDEPDAPDQPALLRLEVNDTGVGFDADKTASLFHRFSQADTSITRRFGGTGLGLSISKALVEMMGGQIWATSRPGEGSTFSLTLPLLRSVPLTRYDRDLAAAEPGPRPDTAEPLGDDLPSSVRILLAEDNLTNQKVVELILTPFGVDLVIVENGARAIEAIQMTRFDLVLMDMQMPVMDGLAATRALREFEQAHPTRPRTPVAMLSANAMPHHCDEATEAGADLHIAKPVTPQALIAGIGQALALSGMAGANEQAR